MISSFCLCLCVYRNSNSAASMIVSAQFSPVISSTFPTPPNFIISFQEETHQISPSFLDKMSSVVEQVLYFFNCASGGLFQIMGKSIFERVFSSLRRTYTPAACLQKYVPVLHVHSVLTILFSSDTCMHSFYCTRKYTKNSLHNVHRVMTSFIMINKTIRLKQNND